MNLIVDIAIFCEKCDTELSKNIIETGTCIYVDPCPNCCKKEDEDEN